MISGPGFWLTFLYYFAIASLIGTFAISRSAGGDLDAGNPYPAGIVFGLLAGLAGGYFNRSTTLNLPFSNEKAFLAKLTTALTELGYREAAPLDEIKVYERPIPGRWFSGKVFVQIEPKAATIVARASQMKALQQRLGA